MTSFNCCLPHSNLLTSTKPAVVIQDGPVPLTRDPRHISSTCRLGPRRGIFLRCPKDARGHFVLPHGLLFHWFIKAQRKIGSTTWRPQNPRNNGKTSISDDTRTFLGINKHLSFHFPRPFIPLASHKKRAANGKTELIPSGYKCNAGC